MSRRVTASPMGELKNQNLLERVQAFANLRFPPVITALKKETDQAELDAIQME
jgi:hypothetical protein